MSKYLALYDTNTASFTHTTSHEVDDLGRFNLVNVKENVHAARLTLRSPANNALYSMTTAVKTNLDEQYYLDLYFSPIAGAVYSLSYLTKDMSLGGVNTGDEVLQRLCHETGDVDHGTGTIPIVNSALQVIDAKPQITQGTEFLRQAITPQKVGSVIHARSEIIVGHSADGTWLQAGLFIEGQSDAVASDFAFELTKTGTRKLIMEHRFVATSLDEIVFTVRAGGHQAGTTVMNGVMANGQPQRIHGGAAKSFLETTELKAI